MSTSYQVQNPSYSGGGNAHGFVDTSDADNIRLRPDLSFASATGKNGAVGFTVHIAYTDPSFTWQEGKTLCGRPIKSLRGDRGFHPVCKSCAAHALRLGAGKAEDLTKTDIYEVELTLADIAFLDFRGGGTYLRWLVSEQRHREHGGGRIEQELRQLAESSPVELPAEQRALERSGEAEQVDAVRSDQETDEEPPQEPHPVLAVSTFPRNKSLDAAGNVPASRRLVSRRVVNRSPVQNMRMVSGQKNIQVSFSISLP